MSTTFIPAAQIAFDVELFDHDEANDTTIVRVSRSDDNRDICRAALSWSDDKLVCAVTTQDVNIASDSLAYVQEQIADAVQAELTVHQSTPDGDKVETLRDLFAVCVPSGSVRALAIGFAR